MPFGLCNAPTTFERLVDNTLRGLKWSVCLRYLDDVVVFSPDFPTHLLRLRLVLPNERRPAAKPQKVPFRRAAADDLRRHCVQAGCSCRPCKHASGRRVS